MTHVINNKYRVHLQLDTINNNSKDPEGRFKFGSGGERKSRTLDCLCRYSSRYVVPLSRLPRTEWASSVDRGFGTETPTPRRVHGYRNNLGVRLSRSQDFDDGVRTGSGETHGR